MSTVKGEHQLALWLVRRQLADVAGADESRAWAHIEMLLLLANEIRKHDEYGDMWHARENLFRWIREE